MNILSLNLRQFGLILGIISFLIIFALNPIENQIANAMAACSVLMAIWWITEAVPLAATSFLPLILFPVLGIMDVKQTSSIFINNTIFLFLGGFLIALAIENNGLHKRMALNIIKLLGGDLKGILLGLIISCWLMSMFITNVATTIMMMPIGISIISALEDKFDKDKVRLYAVALLLGIAYSATLGGISTLVGTVPNLAFKSIYEIQFPSAEPISFASWMAFGVPMSGLMIIILWFLFTKILFPIPNELKLNKSLINDNLNQLGKITRDEKVVLIIVVTTSLLWIFRKNIDLGFAKFYGWSNLLPNPNSIDDSTIAIFMSMLLFLIPAKNRTGNKRLIDNNSIKKLPWDVLLLFGGGFALAKGFQTTGLSEIIGNTFVGLKGVDPFFITFLVCLVVIFLTELTSNTAVTYTFLPILASLSVAINVDPLILMLPATISASFAFMLPVATPPNAIIFSAEKIKIGEMAKAGIWLNIISAILIPLMFYGLGRFIFGVG